MEIDNDIKVTIAIENENGIQDDFVEITIPKDISIEMLKVIIEAQCNIPINQQTLYFKNTSINDDKQTINKLSIENQDVIVVKITKNLNANNNVLNNTNNTNNNYNNNNNPFNNSNTSTNANNNANNNNANNNSSPLDLSMPLFGANSSLPTMPSWLRTDPYTLQQQIRNDPNLLQSLLHSNPTLAEAVLSDDITLLRSYLQQQQYIFQQNLLKEQQRRAALMADPLNPEYQKLIENEIQQSQIDENYETAVEHMPEAFSRVTMLYVPMEVEGHSVTAFIDSGAQSTIMSQQLAEKCGIMRLVDRRFSGIAKGVGTAKIIGRIHIAKIKFGKIYLPCSFTILDDPSMEFLFGLDMLRRHQGIIDLKDNVLRIGTEAVPFLQEKDIASLRGNSLFSDFDEVQHGPESKNDDNKINTNSGNINPNANINNNTSTSSTTATTANRNLTNTTNTNTSNIGTTNQVSSNASNNRNNNDANNLLQQLLAPFNNNQQSSNNNQRTFRDEDIQYLVNLGFSRQQSIQALTICNGNVEMAGAYLFEQNGGFGL